MNAITGNDAYDGTSENWTGGTVGPKSTIQAGVNAVDNGGTVYVAAGTYAGAYITGQRRRAIGAGPTDNRPVIATGVSYLSGSRARAA